MLSEDKLPEKYKESMKALLKDEYDMYIESLGKASVLGLRVNTLKIEKEKLLEMLDLKLKAVPWTDTGFYLEPQSAAAGSSPPTR